MLAPAARGRLGSDRVRQRPRWREGEATMDMATILPWVVLAVGGALGGNILGALTRGGGGIAGRTIIGAIGGVAAGYAAMNVPAVQGVAANWSALIEGENAAHLANAISGAIGGAVLGLVGGLLIRSHG